MNDLLSRLTALETETVQESLSDHDANLVDSWYDHVVDALDHYEVVLDYPTTQQELLEYLTQGLEVSKQNLVVRRAGEPYEEYQHADTKREGALLDDPNYKEAGSPKFEDYYGDTYNSGFVKELNDVLKLQRKERGEEIPSETTVKYNTDVVEDAAGVLKQAEDPRK